MVAIELENVSRTYRGGIVAADGLAVRIPSGKISVLLGASGSGKTTLLRLIAGLERPDCGQIRLDGRDATSLPPSQRGVGMVFQQFVLFPHWNVYRNIAFSVRPEADRDNRVRGAAAMLQIEDLLKRRPTSLSGGQQQRVALARAIAARPAAVLLDEPLAHVDAPLRAEIQGILKRWQREHGVTVVYVTHDEREARELADYLILVDRGRVIAAGDAEPIHQHKSTSPLREGTTNR